MSFMGLNILDAGVIGVYLAGVTLFGLRFRKRDRTLQSYFLADKTVPWWAIAMSIVAAETSTLTIISIPGLAYDQDFRFLQLVVGYMLGRVVVTFVLIPQYMRGNLVTAYQLILRRFGPRMQTLTGSIFLVTRAAAEGVRVFAVAIVVRVALSGLFHGWSAFQSDLCAIGIVVLLTLIYTFEGGMAAMLLHTEVIRACSAVHPGRLRPPLRPAGTARGTRSCTGTANCPSASASSRPARTHTGLPGPDLVRYSSEDPILLTPCGHVEDDQEQAVSGSHQAVCVERGFPPSHHPVRPLRAARGRSPAI